MIQITSCQYFLVFFYYLMINQPWCVNSLSIDFPLHLASWDMLVHAMAGITATYLVIYCYSSLGFQAPVKIAWLITILLWSSNHHVAGSGKFWDTVTIKRPTAAVGMYFKPVLLKLGAKPNFWWVFGGLHNGQTDGWQGNVLYVLYGDLWKQKWSSMCCLLMSRRTYLGSLWRVDGEMSKWSQSDECGAGRKLQAIAP